MMKSLQVFVQKVAPEPPEHLPASLKQLLIRCLSFNLQERPSSPELLLLITSAQFNLVRQQMNKRHGLKQLFFCSGVSYFSVSSTQQKMHPRPVLSVYVQCHSLSNAAG